MRTWIGLALMVGAIACGSPESERVGEGEATGEGADRTEAEPPSEGTTESESGHEAPQRPTDVGSESGSAAASCDRVRPCIEAFVEVAPAELAGPARIALAQLDTSLVETSARGPACAAAIASYRHDLETHDLDVPDACR